MFCEHKFLSPEKDGKQNYYSARGDGGNFAPFALLRDTMNYIVHLIH